MTTTLPALVIEFAADTPTTVRALVWSEDHLQGESRSLALADVASLVGKSEFYYIGLPPTQLQQFGQTLYRWLDGDERRLSAALDQLPGRPPFVVLAVVAGNTDLDRLPWELLHDGRQWCHERGSLALVPVRCVKPPPPAPSSRPHELRPPTTPATGEPANRPLEVVFMAASPEIMHGTAHPSHQPLDYEAEEGRILQAAAPHGSVRVFVEESGNVEELGLLWQSLAERPPDVLHLTGHAGHDSDGPIFVLETLEGTPDLVSPGQLNLVLGGSRPRLAFLSGCRTGQPADGGDGPSFAQRLVRDGWPAVLAWGNKIADHQATYAATLLYGHLESGRSLCDALGRTWWKLRDERATEWHLLRLYCYASIPANLVTPKAARGRLTPRKVAEDKFLDPLTRRSKVADRLTYVGRRRLLQRAVRQLKTPHEGHVGLLLHGQGGRGKSSTAARLCDRLQTRFSPVVVIGKLDEWALINAICLALPRNLELTETAICVERTLRDSQLPLAYRLELALQESAKLELGELLFVLDDFEQNQPRADAGELALETDAAQLLRLLCEACSTTGLGRVLITGRYELPADFHRWLTREQVLPLNRSERLKQQSRCQQRKELPKSAEKLLPEAIKAADGNPLLYEWLFQVLHCPGLDHAALLGDLAGKENEFRIKVLMQRLVASLPAQGTAMLARLLVFEETIPETLVAPLCADLAPPGSPGSGVAELFERCVALGLADRYATAFAPDDSGDTGEAEIRVVRQLTRGDTPLIAPAAGELAVRMTTQALPILDERWWQDGGCAEPQLFELTRLAAIAGDRSRLIKFARELAWRLIDTHRAQECLELLNPLLDVAGRAPMLLLHAARAEERLGDGARCDALMQELSRRRDELPPADRVEVGWHEAQCLRRNGQFDEALARLRDEVIPTARHNNQDREVALAMGQIADILQARGQLDEALRIRREEELPVYERLGSVRDMIVGRVKLALNLVQRGQVADGPEIGQLLFTSHAEAQRLGLPEAGQIAAIVKQLMNIDI